MLFLGAVNGKLGLASKHRYHSRYFETFKKGTGNDGLMRKCAKAADPSSVIWTHQVMWGLFPVGFHMGTEEHISMPLPHPWHQIDKLQFKMKDFQRGNKEALRKWFPVFFSKTDLSTFLQLSLPVMPLSQLCGSINATHMGSYICTLLLITSSLGAPRRGRFSVLSTTPHSYSLLCFHSCVYDLRKQCDRRSPVLWFI